MRHEILAGYAGPAAAYGTDLLQPALLGHPTAPVAVVRDRPVAGQADAIVVAGLLGGRVGQII